MSNNSQYKKAKKAINTKNTTVFNTEYSVSGNGTLTGEESLSTYQSMLTEPRTKTSANIVQQAFRNQEARYGSRPPSPYNTNSSRSSPVTLPTSEGGKSRKSRKNRKNKKTRSKKNRRGTRKN